MKTLQGSCLKVAVFLFSCVFLLFAALLFVFGFVLPTTSDPGSVNPCLLVYGIGAVTAFIALLGACGSLRENYGSLMAFVSVIAVSLILQLSAVGLLVYHKNAISETAIHEFQSLIRDYHVTNSSRSYVDNLQSSFKCCGVQSRDDWKDPESGSTSFPDSCCPQLTNGTCTHTYEKPCYDAITEELLRNIALLMSSFMIFFLFQVLLMCFAWNQAKFTRRDYYRFV